MYIVKPVTPEDFHAMFSCIRRDYKEIRRRTSEVGLEDYVRKFNCYQVCSNRIGMIGRPVAINAGFAINKTTGELCSMFNATGESLGHMMVETAVRLGARRLNCLDGYLVKLYSDHGFVPVCAVEHHRHTPERPRPMVVYMAHESTRYGAAAVERHRSSPRDLPSMGLCVERLDREMVRPPDRRAVVRSNGAAARQEVVTCRRDE